MKYLLYYNLDSQFVTDQTAAGGDGTNVVSVVDGVAWTKDQENTYYRYAKPDSENLTSYTITIHYKNVIGDSIAPDDVVTVDGYVEKSSSEYIFAKEIEGFIVSGVSSEVLLVSSNTEYTFFYSIKRPDEDYLMFDILSGGTIIWTANSSANTKTISYTNNNGISWVDITSSTAGTVINVSAGDKLFFKGDNSGYGGNSYSEYSTFSGSTAKFNLGGNIMSLISGTGFSGLTVLSGADWTFHNLFAGCTGLTSAEELNLPATALSTYFTYFGMFKDCTSLTKAPELPATNIYVECYEEMFAGCTSLTKAPSILPAMNLKSTCYRFMFLNCTSLRTAPELPATNLYNNCYTFMFNGCTNLNYIKCLATDISAQGCTDYWVTGVQTNSGTFVKNPNMSSWTRGEKGIPNNWTVQDAN